MQLPFYVPYFFITERARCFYFIVMTWGIDALTNAMKLSYHQPRPFWVSDDVQAFACSSQYGNPSGHSTIAMGTAVYLWLDYNSWAIDASTRDTPSQFSKWYWRLIFAVLGLVYAVTIAYSRMFLGVHSFNQVFFGLSMGAWFAVTGHFIFRERIVKLA